MTIGRAKGYARGHAGYGSTTRDSPAAGEKCQTVRFGISIPYVATASRKSVTNKRMPTGHWQSFDGVLKKLLIRPG